MAENQSDLKLKKNLEVSMDSDQNINAQKEDVNTINTTLEKAIFESVSAYSGDELNLPVEDLELAIPFYMDIFGFNLSSKREKSAILERDGLKIGLAENGGDPSQEGCFFRVNNVEVAFAELKRNGLNQRVANYRTDEHGDSSFKVFFVVAPDGLCYCLGQKL